MQRLFLYVTRDEYELPLYVADSIEELASYAEVKRGTVESALSKIRHGTVKRSRYREVYVDD